MNAKPNLNGNSPESFLEAGERLHATANNAKKQIRNALAEITHGRNYQHIAPASPAHVMNSARSDDLARVVKIIKALDDLEAIGRELYDAGST